MASGLLERFRTAKIRTQLLLAYGGTVGLVFLIALLILVISIFSLRDRVLGESSSALRKQIVQNGGFILAEDADLIEARLIGGVQRLALPTAFAYYEASRSDRAYSVAAPQSYPDNDASLLKQPTVLDEFNRYPCNSSQPPADMARRGCQGKTVGDDDLPFKSISPDASAVFLKHFKLDGSNVEEIMTREAAQVNLTAHMDRFVETAWRQSSVWMGAWIGLAGSTPQMRVFPGYVGDLSDDDGFRDYDVTTRPFWKAQEQAAAASKRISTTNEGQGRFSVSYSGPYVSLYGDGLLFTASVPVHDLAGTFKAVAGTDVKATILADIVANARIRESGQIHMYQLASGWVAASPQWDASGDTLMQARQISLPFWEGHTLDEDNDCHSIEDADSHAVIKRKTLGGKYCLAAVVPGEEILRPIEAQREEIKSSTNSLFVLCLLVLLGCLFVLVVPCIIFTAINLSRPLVKICQETNTMARNIGGDLLEGIDLSKETHGPGEIGQLGIGFRRLLFRLKAKRDFIGVPPLNPLYGQCQFDDGQCGRVAGITVTPGTPHTLEDSADGNFTAEVPLSGQIRARICLLLILPMIVALSGVIAFTSTQMYGNINDWLEPVKNTMVQEELQTMSVRAAARAKYVEEILDTYQTMVHMVKSYAEKLYDDELPLLTPHCSSHPTLQPIANSLCGASPIFVADTKRQLTQDKQSTRRVDFERLAWYHPQQSVAPVQLRYSGAKATMSSAVDEHQGRTAHLANAARVAYFSSDTSYVYFGFEVDEVYTQYPYEDLEGFYSSMKCSDGSRPARYTPLCKIWYQKARDAAGQVAFSPVDVSSATGFPYVSAGAAIFQNGNKLVGVAAVDVDLGKLKQSLRETPLYESGNVYIFDDEAYVVVHPAHDELSGRKRVIEIAAGDDRKFAEGFQREVIDKHGSVGGWVYPWYNPATGKEENWYYRFHPIQGTPYQLVMGVVDREIEASARQLEEDLYSLANTCVTLSTVFFALGAAILVYVSYRIQIQFVVPITDISDLLVRSETDKGYTGSVPSEDGVWSSELIAVLGNFRRLVVALRFGNAAYHKGNRIQELHNLRNAQQIVEETGNKRGQGVCLNSLGHCVHHMEKTKQQTANLTESEADVVGNLQRAVDNARELANTGAGAGAAAAEDSYGLRSLGLGLALLGDGDVETCRQHLRNASQAYKKTGSWQKLAQLAFTLVTLKPENKKKLTLDDMNWAASQGEEAAGLLLGNQEAKTLEPQFCTAVAQLCFAIASVRSEWGLLRWCLARLPNLDTVWVLRLAAYVKVHFPNEIERIDVLMIGVENWVPGALVAEDQVTSALQDQEKMWKAINSGGGSAPPKTLQFVLDCSGSMSGGYLNTCKGAIQNILENFTAPKDHVALLAFAHYTKEIFPITLSEGNEDMMKQRVGQLATFGGTAFYDAVLESMHTLKGTGLTETTWLVALTDGADTHSKVDKGSSPGSQACQLLATGGVNMAVITVGSLPEDTISVIHKYVAAAKSGGMEAVHIEASDTAAIGEAFQAIAQLMDQGLTEAL